MPEQKILIVEDIASLSLSYAAQLEEAGFSCVIADSGAAAKSELKNNSGNFAAILLDLQLPDMDGLELLDSNPDLVTNSAVVVATADGSISRAIDAMRRGSFDFMVKPLSGKRLISTMQSAVQSNPSEKEATPKSQSSRKVDGYMGFVGMSYPMQKVYEQVANVARSRATIFITGESGTGKEVCAEAIHQAGPRAPKPFVAINCGAIPEELLESELFGHLKGSFTGAIADRIGAVQAANEGTLFLDEICEMELKLQVKLLRFLQTGMIQRVGSARPEEVDVRIVCATNRNPEKEVADGRFREDLFYRLAVVPIELPPLRARGTDIILLANTFLERFGKEEDKNFDRIEGEVALAFAQHDWPGNVRELQNTIRRATVMCEGPKIPIETVPQISSMSAADELKNTAIAAGGLNEPSGYESLGNHLDGLTLNEVERIVIENAIEKSQGSIPSAALLLGVSPSTLYRKREKWFEHELKRQTN